MTEGVWIAIIGCMQAVMLAILARLRSRAKVTSEDARIAREQTQNSHRTNLRDDLDQNHAEIMDAIRGTQKDIGRLDTRDIERGRDVRRLDQKLDRVDDKLDEHLEWSREYVAERETETRSATQRLEDLERTQDLNKETP